MKTARPERGFSLTELMFVLAVIAVISAIAVPAFSDVHARRLQAAASEVTTALRFARSEAVRTGVPHGVRKSAGDNSISVFRMDATKMPAVEIHDIRHPSNPGTFYKVDLAAHRDTRATRVAAVFRIFRLGSVHEAISFDARGEPVDGVSGLPLEKTEGGFVLNNGDRGVTVSVSRLSGRVSASDVGAAVANPQLVF